MRISVMCAQNYKTRGLETRLFIHQFPFTNGRRLPSGVDSPYFEIENCFQFSKLQVLEETLGEVELQMLELGSYQY